MGCVLLALLLGIAGGLGVGLGVGLGRKSSSSSSSSTERLVDGIKTSNLMTHLRVSCVAQHTMHGATGLFVIFRYENLFILGAPIDC